MKPKSQKPSSSNFMLNKCTNYLIVEGSQDQILKIYAGFQSKNCFGSLIGSNPNCDSKKWFLSNLEWFGTEWDINPESADPLLISATRLIVCFGTAWTAPKLFAQKLSKKYSVEVYLEFKEPSRDIAGIVEYDKYGNLIDEKNCSYQTGVELYEAAEFEFKITKWKKMVA